MVPETVNVQDALAIRSEQSKQFSDLLCSNFHSTIKKKFRTTVALKKAITVKRKANYDIKMLYSQLLVMGQQHNTEVDDVFQFELSPVPPALIGKYGCLRKGNKAMLIKSLSVSVTTPPSPDVVLVDAGQLLYHIVLSVARTAGDLAASGYAQLAHYPPSSKKSILFDRCDQETLSTKNH